MNLKGLEKISYGNHDEWLSIRTDLGVGGSESAAAGGQSPYMSPHFLWMIKTHRVTQPDISDREAVRLGNDLEQYVADRFMEDTGKKVQRCNFILKNPKYPFAFANPDRLVVGENSGLECKTTSSYEVVEECKNGFPIRYYHQCVHYMAVTGADRWYLAVCCFGRGFYTFCLERNQAEIDALMDIEREFWDMVQNDTPPEIDGSDSTTDGIRTYYGQSDGSTVDLTPVASALEMRSRLKAQIDDLKALQQEQENIIMDYMGSAETGSYGKYKVSWKNGTRKSVDYKAYEASHAGCFAEYTTVNNTRTLRVTEKKEK